MIQKLLLLLAALLCSSSAAFAADWGLPLELSDKNTKIRFEIDSTWHRVRGTTTGITGKIVLADPADPSTVRGEVHAPVARFDTDNSSRDKTMREVMAAETYPDVKFALSGIEIGCTPSSLAAGQACSATLRGDLTIRGQTKPWEIPATLSLLGNRYELRGTGRLRWSDFGVEDPSIFVARLSKDVTVFIETDWDAETR
ncbi:MAG: YceI family protein [Bdellovibrionota bacterium]